MTSKRAGKGKSGTNKGKSAARTAPRTERLDVSVYAHRIQQDAAMTIALAKKIAPRVPSAPPAVKLAGAVVAESSTELVAEWSVVKKKAPDVRPLDIAVDRHWSALSGRVQPWTVLDHANAGKAQSVMDVLFQGGLAFTQLPWSAQCVEGDKRLAQLRTKGLWATLVELAGKPFVDALVAQQDAYREALGLDGSAAEDDGDDAAAVRPLLDAAQQAIVDYAVQVAAAHNAEPDAKKRKGLRAALKPIDDARAAAAPTASAASGAAATAADAKA